MSSNSVSLPSLTDLLNKVKVFFDTETHKLLGVATGAYGVNTHNWHTTVAGLAYAAIVQAADAVKAWGSPKA